MALTVAYYPLPMPLTCSSLNPCVVRFVHSKIRQHLTTCLENGQVSRFP